MERVSLKKNEGNDMDCQGAVVLGLVLALCALIRWRRWFNPGNSLFFGRDDWRKTKLAEQRWDIMDKDWTQKCLHLITSHWSIGSTQDSFWNNNSTKKERFEQPTSKSVAYVTQHCNWFIKFKIKILDICKKEVVH